MTNQFKLYSVVSPRSTTAAAPVIMLFNYARWQQLAVGMRPPSLAHFVKVKVSLFVT